MRHILYPSLIIFTLILNGCSITTPLFSSKPVTPLFIADIPPNRLTVAGKYTGRDLKFIDGLVAKMLAQPYKNHTYKYRQGVSVSYDVSHANSTEFSSSRGACTSK